MYCIRRYLLITFLLSLVVSSLFSQDNLRICAVRVEFQPDINDLTTGDGNFVIDTSEVTPFTIDPPPHDRIYFLDQINAVRNYYEAASKKRINITGQVYPLVNNTAYQLPHPMGYYNPNTTDEENNFQLAQLFLDAINLVDQDDDIIFSEFDLVTVFHAGVGNDIELGFDETPQDIPSLYLSPEFLKENLGDTFEGIIVDGGTTIIDRGIILPETESQAGFELALTGIFAANIGSYLGLYDLFSPSTKLPGIGRFGLMDSGLFNLFGLTPALPCAFSRELMGWDIPHLVKTPQENLPLSRLRNEDSELPSVYKIPVNSDEYLLVEFRGDSDVNIDSLYVVISEGRDISPTYLEVLKTYYQDRIVVSDSTGVLLSVDDYDWGLPGAGTLIWHVDQSIVNDKSGTNKINDNRENRAVDLEEADGSQDIGYEYSIIEPGFNSELGTWLDFWFQSNPAPLYKNEFSKSTSPNSRTNRNFADSHIRLSGFSDNSGELMTLDYTRNLFEEGFPVQLPADSNVIFSNPMVGTVGPLSKMAIFVSDSKGNIYAVTDSGHGLIYPQKILLAEHSGQMFPDLALVDIDSDTKYDQLIASSESGHIDILQFTDLDSDSLIDTVRTLNIYEKITTVPVVHERFLYVGSESGELFRFALPSGQLDTTYQYNSEITAITIISPQDIKVTLKSESQTELPPTIIDLNSDAAYDTISSPTFDRFLIETGDNLKSIPLEENMVSRPSFADLEDDGFYEIVFNYREKIQAINYNGSNVSNFPISPKLQDGESLIGTPIVFDANNDSRVDVIVTTSYGQIFAFDFNGRLIPGFPASFGGSVSQTLVAENIDNDDYIELFALNDQGKIFAWQLESLMDQNTFWWNQYNHTPSNNNFIMKQLEPVNSDVKELMPSKSVYNYPNPNQQNFTTIRYYLKESASVHIKIFDLAGDIVASFIGPGQGNLFNEKRWDLTDVSSGIYLCRIEANSVSDNSVKIIKIMVVN